MNDTTVLTLKPPKKAPEKPPNPREILIWGQLWYNLL